LLERILLTSFLLLSFCKLSIAQDSLIFLETFGKYHNASSISTAREEFIFVADMQTNKIYKLTAEGTELATFGGPGLGPNELNQPYSIDASNGLDVLVADFQNNRIKRLDFKLNFIFSFDFNSYNLTAESSKKIYNPVGIMTLSTDELFVLCDATNYRVAKISSFTDVSIVFGSNSFGMDRLDKPKKIVRGIALDMWILDKPSDEILNFNNFGTYVQKLSHKGNDGIISIAYYNDNLFILQMSSLLIYDLKKGQYTASYFYPFDKRITDIALLDKNTVLLLSTKKIYKYKLNYN
jgi:hypothetical protein